MTKTTTDRINLDLVDQLLRDYKKPEDILGENGLLKQFTKALLERAMQVELTEHLGYEKHDASGDNSGNSRNGTSEKTLKGDFGTLPIEVPRDRNSEFEPKIVPKGKTRLDGFNEKILSLYARGLTTERDSTAHRGNLQSRSFTNFDFQCHGSRVGRCRGMADAPARSPLSDPLHGCAASEDQRRGVCHKQSCSSSDWRHARRKQRGAWSVARSNRRREAVVADRDRVKESRSP